MEPTTKCNAYNTITHINYCTIILLDTLPIALLHNCTHYLHYFTTLCGAIMFSYFGQLMIKKLGQLLA